MLVNVNAVSDLFEKFFVVVSHDGHEDFVVIDFRDISENLKYDLEKWVQRGQLFSYEDDTKTSGVKSPYEFRGVNPFESPDQLRLFSVSGEGSGATERGTQREDNDHPRRAQTLGELYARSSGG